MNLWPALLITCGIVLAIGLGLLWRPKPSRTKPDPSTNHRNTDLIFRDDNRY